MVDKLPTSTGEFSGFLNHQQQIEVTNKAPETETQGPSVIKGHKPSRLWHFKNSWICLRYVKNIFLKRWFNGDESHGRKYKKSPNKRIQELQKSFF